MRAVAGIALGIFTYVGAALAVAGDACDVAAHLVHADAELPPSDRIAHLLLALRADEEGFATVANLAFVGAPRRVRARMRAPMRPALDRAAKARR